MARLATCRPERARLEVEDLAGQRIALLGQAAQGEAALLQLLRRFLRAGALGDQVGKSGQRRVDLDAAPGPAAAARVWPRVEQVQRRRHVCRFHSGEGVAVERQPLRVDEGAAEPRAGRQHQDRRGRMAAHALRLGHAAHVAVVADDQRNRTPGALGTAPRRTRCARRSRQSSRAGSATCRTRRSAGTDPESPGQRRRPAPSRARCPRGSRRCPRPSRRRLPVGRQRIRSAAAADGSKPSCHRPRPRPSWTSWRLRPFRRTPAVVLRSCALTCLRATRFHQRSSGHHSGPAALSPCLPLAFWPAA